MEFSNGGKNLNGDFIDTEWLPRRGTLLASEKHQEWNHSYGKSLVPPIKPFGLSDWPRGPFAGSDGRKLSLGAHSRLSGLK
jgi:hypothetical protein